MTDEVQKHKTAVAWSRAGGSGLQLSGVTSMQEVKQHAMTVATIGRGQTMMEIMDTGLASRHTSAVVYNIEASDKVAHWTARAGSAYECATHSDPHDPQICRFAFLELINS